MFAEKVNILGTEYTIEQHAEEDTKLNSCDGYMDHSVKLIVVGTFEESNNSVSSLENYSKKVLRHEITHAFLYESGLWNNSHEVNAWGKDEEITDWLAIQIPKMVKAMQEAGCL